MIKIPAPYSKLILRHLITERFSKLKRWSDYRNLNYRSPKGEEMHPEGKRCTRKNRRLLFWCQRCTKRGRDVQKVSEMYKKGAEMYSEWQRCKIFKIFKNLILKATPGSKASKVVLITAQNYKIHNYRLAKNINYENMLPLTEAVRDWVWVRGKLQS